MYDHFRCVELPLTIDEFHRLPRNAAYKYEYFGGRAVLTPRPKAFHCVRDTDPFEVPGGYAVEPLLAAEIPGLEDLFAWALSGTQPFQSLDADAAVAAARDCVARVLDGREGPLVEAACVRVLDPRESARPVGAALVTLAHEDVLTVPFAGEWKDPPPNAVERRLGCPHLTWVFVHPFLARRGVGTAALAGVVRALSGMSYPHLASTFALDNGPSALWHWRNGFRLLPQMSAMDVQVAKRRGSF